MAFRKIDMKKYLTLNTTLIALALIALTFCLPLQGQSDKKMGHVQYDMFVDLEAVKGQKIEMTTGNTHLAELYFSLKQSLFIFGAQTENTSERKELVGEEQGIEIEQNYGSELGHQYLSNLETQTLTAFEMMFDKKGINNYQIKERLPELKWQIHWQDTKKISGFYCHKATADFRGRHYTAWFTRAIPVSFGPWKLGGLPGLILEAHTEHYEIWFLLRSLAYPAQKLEVPFELPDAPQISWEDYVKNWRQWAKKTLGYQTAQSIESGGNQQTSLYHMENIFNR